MKTQTRPARLHVQSRRWHHVGHILVSALPPTSTFWLFQAFLGDPPASPGLLGKSPVSPGLPGSPQPHQAFLGGLPNFPGAFLRAHGYGGHRQSDPWVTCNVLQLTPYNSVCLLKSQALVPLTPFPTLLQLSGCCGDGSSISQGSAGLKEIQGRRACHHTQIPASLFPQQLPPPLPFSLYFTFQTHCYILPLPGYFTCHGQSFPILHLFALLNQY